jgi:hypothetical protein
MQGEKHLPYSPIWNPIFVEKREFPGFFQMVFKSIVETGL